MAIIIPIWFYEFGMVMYLAAAVIGGMISYYSLKLYGFSNRRQHILLHAGFVFVTFGFLALAYANASAIVNFDTCHDHCSIYESNAVYGLISSANYGYYFTSIIGYMLIALSYTKEIFGAGRRLFAVIPFTGLVIPSQKSLVLYPFDTPLFQIFHIVAFAVMAYIVIRALAHYRRAPRKLSLLVLLGFCSILAYHIMMYAVALSPTFFALAHVALLAGFGAMLLMLVKVNEK